MFSVSACNNIFSDIP